MTMSVRPDLTVGVTASPNPVGAGATHTYVLSVTNAGWGSFSLSLRQIRHRPAFARG